MMSPVRTSWRTQREGMRCDMTETMATNETCTRLSPLKPFSFKMIFCFYELPNVFNNTLSSVLCSADTLSKSLPSPCVPDLFKVDC